MAEPFPCSQKDLPTGQFCGQMIIVSETEQHPSGRRKVKNFYDGIGGYRGDDHICPYRSGGAFDRSRIPNWEQHYKKIAKRHCTTCALIYYSTAFNLCPNCFKIRCRECKRLRIWKTDDIRCPACLCITFDVMETYPKIEAIIEKLKKIKEKELGYALA